MTRIFILLCFLVQTALAQEIIDADKVSLLKQRAKADISFSLINFQESLKDSSMNDINVHAQLYGYTLSYNYRFYHNVYAYSVGLGYGQGNAVAGSSGGTYYEKRVPWQSLSLILGGYRRFSAYFEAGPVFMVQHKNLTWPLKGSDEIQSPSNPYIGIFLEFRQRLGMNYDLYQDIGILGESKNTAWNLGVSFNL